MKPRAFLAAAIFAFAVAASSAHAVDTKGAPAWQAITLGKNTPYRFAAYGNHPLDGSLADITQAIVIQHGLNRDGDAYYLAGAQLMQDLGVDPARTLLIAPQFFIQSDAGKPGLEDMPLWTRDGWVVGLDAVGGNSTVSSLAVYDDLIAWLTDAQRIPHLKRLVLAGHSAGGQLVVRYAILNHIDEQARNGGLLLRYVVANPSSYLYFTGERPRSDGEFMPYDRGACPDYNDYRYGFERMIAYGRGLDAAQAFARYAARDVVYLLGERDVNPRHRLLDKSCAAETQGRYRLERGLNYLRHEANLAAGRIALAHHAYTVHGVPHNQRGMFSSVCGARALFAASNDASGARCTPLDPSGNAVRPSNAVP